MKPKRAAAKSMSRKGKRAEPGSRNSTSRKPALVKCLFRGHNQIDTVEVHFAPLRTKDLNRTFCRPDHSLGRECNCETRKRLLLEEVRQLQAEVRSKDERYEALRRKQTRAELEGLEALARLREVAGLEERNEEIGRETVGLLNWHRGTSERVTRQQSFLLDFD